MGMKLLLGSTLLAVSLGASADLNVWEDYEVSESVWSITTVKVDSNMVDAYLEGIKNTWVPPVEIQKNLGYIEDWAIYVSELPASGDFNMMLVIEFADTADLAPNKERYQRFMAEYSQSASDRATDFAQENYPAMREIAGEYRVRRVTFLD